MIPLRETKNLTTHEIIRMQRSVNHSSAKVLEEFFSGLSIYEQRLLINTYLKTFLPFNSQSKEKDSVCIKILQNKYSEEQKETILLNKINEQITNNYFNKISKKNPISKNTLKKEKNKCILLKKLPQIKNNIIFRL